jgi:site-specific DNA recombinase
LQGFHTGGRCFGYRSVPTEHPTEKDNYGRPKVIGVRLEIEPTQATTVLRIFAEYAAGCSLKTIAKRLNSEAVASPAPYRGQRHPSWSPSALWVILRNERYRGVVIWNRTRKVRDPQTGRRINRRRPRSGWKVFEAPHLRIVPEDLWKQVQHRLSSIRTNFRPALGPGLCARSYSSAYLFSGFLKCGLCGSNVVLVAGRGQSAYAKYGCPLHHQRGICENGLLIRREKLEQEILAGLQRDVLREDAVSYAMEEFGRQLRARVQATHQDLAGVRQRREQLKAEIGNLARAIAERGHSSALLSELSSRERELEAINDELLSAEGNEIDMRLEEIESFVHQRLKDTQGLLLRDVARAKAELAKHCRSITLTPEGESYRLSGEWDLLGSVRLSGAGGQNRTAYAGLFRAALYR